MEYCEKKGFTFYEVSENELVFVNKDKWALFIVYDKNITRIYEFAVEICSKMLFFAKTEEFFKVSSFLQSLILTDNFYSR